MIIDTNYGSMHLTPTVGDAILYNLDTTTTGDNHVAISGKKI